jgi:hypothetical protein
MINLPTTASRLIALISEFEDLENRPKSRRLLVQTFSCRGATCTMIRSRAEYPFIFHLLHQDIRGLVEGGNRDNYVYIRSSLVALQQLSQVCESSVMTSLKVERNSQYLRASHTSDLAL